MHEELEAIDWILVVCAVTCVRYISLESMLFPAPKTPARQTRGSLTPLRALTAVLNASRAGAASRRRIGRNGSVRA